MQSPQFPFKARWQLTQTYAENANNYPEGHHGALDIVAFDNSWNTYPAEIFPVFDGTEISIQLSDPVKGKGIKVRTTFNTEKESDFTDYLKQNGLLPKDYSGDVNMDWLYWHILDGIDIDGTAEQVNAIAHQGNTGWVFHNGKPVPDDQKGKPPYLGIHLHLECAFSSPQGFFNLDKDPRGRINPQLILNYKPTMAKRFRVDDHGKKGVLLSEGFGGYIVYAKDPEAYKDFLEDFEVPADAPLITLP